MAGSTGSRRWGNLRNAEAERLSKIIRSTGIKVD